MRIASGSVIAHKYRLEAQLARGGMGAVWTARHLTLGSPLAIKFLDQRLASSPSFVARFELEARVAAAIESPHVVHVMDFGVEDGSPYIVMELLRGEDLRSRLRRVGRLTLTQTADLLVQVGKALRRAHEAGIVHRDIKPGNLFLARVDDQEILKVLDFGIAKRPDRAGDATRTGEIVGTPHYVSPEQARGDKDVDHRTDVWSVGVIAYRMLTSRLPFPGEGFGTVLSKVLVEAPPGVRTFVPSLPAALDRFFTRALAKKREERFQSVRELVDAFVAIARREALEDSLSPPSWSSIHSASVPPADPEPDPEPEPERRPPQLSAPSFRQRDTVPDAEEAGGGDVAPEIPLGAPKHDSLSPATGPGRWPGGPVRFHWVVLAAMALFTLLALLLVWLRGDDSPAAATSTAQPASPLTGPDVAARPSYLVPPPSSNPPPPQVIMKASSTPPPSASAPHPGALPAPSGSSPHPRRRWGF